MSRLRDLSIRGKLMAVLSLTAVLAVVLASAAFFLGHSRTLRRELAAGLESLAALLGVPATHALVYGDREAAGRLLAGLEGWPHVTGAWIFDRDGTVFAEYRRGSAAGPPPAPPGPDGHVFADDHLVVDHRMRFAGQEVGGLRIRSDLGELGARRREALRLLVLAGLGASAVALAAAAGFERLVSKPVLGLVRAVRTVSGAGDASRAARGSEREIAGLIRDLGEMLGEIERRDEELRVARDRAEQANRSKSAFLANMSHELRTPLTAIIGYSEILADDARELGMTDFLPDLEKIRAAGQHLLGLINSILDLSKVEAGKMDVLPERFEIRALIHEVADTSRPLMEKNGNVLEVTAPDHLGRALSDLTKVRQILLNLLSNAAKFTERGRVVLDARRAPGDDTDWLVVRVTDSGIGMTAEQLGKLFQPFSQADASTGRSYGGTGLGLALSQRLAELLCGKIKVASRYGSGSTFTVKLPTDVVAAEQHRKTIERMMLESRYWRLKPRRASGAAAPLVLVVDDDPGVRGELGRLLEQEGWTVAEAEDGVAALRRVAEREPALILLDLEMPRMDGFDFVAQLRKHAAWRDIPVVVLTAEALRPEELERLGDGVEKVLEKSARSPQELESQLRSLARSLSVA